MHRPVPSIRETTRVALVTSRHVDHLSTDDCCLGQALTRRRARVEWVCWDDAAVDWPSFDCVVLRSTWDYHRRIGEFMEWLGARSEDGTALFNSPSLVRWNAHKQYLFELSRGGVTIPPSILLRRGALNLKVSKIAELLGTRRLVIKPAVSASSRATFLIDDPEAPEAAHHVGVLREHSDVIVQAFVPEIQTAGEISLIFFGYAFSHAVRKIPAAGEFRSQSSFGARVERVTPDAATFALAQQAMDLVTERPLYTRVDVIPAAEGPVLMELELIEPVLFLGHAPLSSDVLASQIIRRAGERAAEVADETPRALRA